MAFEIVGDISAVAPIAAGNKLRRRKELHRRYGQGRWRKLKGFAKIRLAGGEIRGAEVHWYEAHGVGRRGFKIKRFLD